MKLQEKEVSAYEAEYQNVAERLKRELSAFKEADPFLAMIQAHFSFASLHIQHPNVIIAGSGFPEELVHAFGVAPYWVLGGSLQTGLWAGEQAPRDADPVSRSMLGILLESSDLTRDALILLPIVSDSTRKLAYLLRRSGKTVCTIDIPPEKNEAAFLKYERQLELCVQALAAHTKRRLTKDALRASCKSVALARREMSRLIQLDREKPSLLPAPWRMLALNSYYFTDNIQHWTRMLFQLNNRIEISRVYQRHQYHGSVLLVGSPIYFPNYKIPFLLEDVGLHIAAHIDYTTQKVKTVLSVAEAANTTLSSLARQFYQADCSGSYAKNGTLQTAVTELLDSHHIDGVVYCVLKGQIEYDFELDRLEMLCGERNIPVFRLETDYNQQDVEQLRIRMEAFSEMLQQRQYQKGVAV